MYRPAAGFKLVAAAQTFRTVPAQVGHWLYLAYREDDASTICRPVFLFAQDLGFCQSPGLLRTAAPSLEVQHGLSGPYCATRLQSGVQGRLADPEPRGGLSDIQPAAEELPRPLQLFGGDNWSAPAFTTACGGGGQPGFGAFADQVALELAVRLR